MKRKVCPKCGLKNITRTVWCAECGEEISSIEPIEVANAELGEVMEYGKVVQKDAFVVLPSKQFWSMFLVSMILGYVFYGIINNWTVNDAHVPVLYM